MYSFLFKPIVKELIWGSESWDISCREGDMSVIENGKLAGMPFIDAINSDRETYLGQNFKDDEVFPLLVKIIDAKLNLSIQVHPDDADAQRIENEPNGKSESWYIIDPGLGYLIIGLKDGVTKASLRAALNDGTAEDCFAKLEVKEGDIIDISAGLVHAITGGVKLLEIQQNSDTTYRVFDYNRKGLDGKPRELHVEKALDVINFNSEPRENTYFTYERLNVEDNFKQKTDGGTFFIYTCVKGSAEFVSGDEKTVVSCNRSVFVPAALGEFVIKNTGGEAASLIKTIPHKV